MTRFLGTHRNRLDAKGRVSVPAPFRAALKVFADQAGSEEARQIVLRPSHSSPCIEAWPHAVFADLEAPLARIDTFSEHQDDLAFLLYTQAHPMEPDKEGRIVLPEALVSHAGLTDAVVFVGLGRTFQIWEPEAVARRQQEALERARARALTLPSGRPAA